MALGRQGNWFLWGFCAPPEEMTEEARSVFVNTVFYMEKFDGQKPLVKKKYRAREWAPIFTRYLDDERVKKSAVREYEASLLKACEGDSAKLNEMLKENLEYRVGTGKFRIDEDAKAVGISNRDTKMLEYCVAVLEKGEDPKRALRLLGRYTDPAKPCGKDAAKWRKWLDGCGDRLYFSDTGGYRWYVRPQ